MKKLFTSDKFFLAMVLCAAVGEVIFAIMAIFWDDYVLQSQLTLLFRVICVVTLYISYKHHSKNIMKGMMGALLAAQLITAIQYFSELSIPAGYVCIPLFAIFSALMFANHFVINADRKASPRMIKLNQLLIVLLFLNNTVYGIIWLFVDSTPLYYAMFIADFIGFLGMAATIVCVESRLDAYRLDREAAGWTEEEGYPEGYVHEYQKK